MSASSVVYRIVNQSNGCVYIGSTQEFEKRKARHLRSLRKGRHHSILMQVDWTNQKGQNFTIKIIGRYPSRHDAYKQEFDLIQKHLELGKCYNTLIGGNGGDTITFHPNKVELIKMRAEYLARWRKSLTPDQLEKIARDLHGSKNPNWRGGRKRCACGTPICNNNTTCSECRDRTGINNPFFGKRHPPEVIKRIADSNRGRPSPGRKKVMIDGVEYVSQTEAANQLGLHITVVAYRIRSKNPMFSQYEYV